MWDSRAIPAEEAARAKALTCKEGKSQLAGVGSEQPRIPGPVGSQSGVVGLGPAHSPSGPSSRAGQASLTHPCPHSGWCLSLLMTAFMALSGGVKYSLGSWNQEERSGLTRGFSGWATGRWPTSLA